MLFIIIPVYNRWHFTHAVLNSLMRQSNKLFKIIVVDHGSTDGTSDHIASQFPEVIVLKGDNSMWWTAAVNKGIRYALQENALHILTLNNDTVAESDYIAQLYKAIDNAPANSIIGSASIDVNTKEITYCGEKLNWFLESSTKNIKHLNSVQTDKGLLPVTHFPGRGLLIPVQVFDQIGLFDDKYFPHYMADYEFTLRAVKNGFPLFCATDARIGTYPEASGANQIKAMKTVKGYKQHLFGIKGGGNLPLFYRYAFRHCPVYALPTHLFLGTFRRLIGYWV
ncbi:glycosyltransferase family 2 protein [Mucilaginibacter gotjawali]|uniref:GT2 family glycosyltransferase n=1 Tax=Mucilaginibacter gotjawali TaxID=1550579 RepID=A0A839SAU2_9SPHI|nr:glycosyltransferase family 2 protein [Mucilaginibacter gotjawali]MBB3054363.1 GT2 family glycosyltransferase [Mucilaginibacter gotjawali]